MLASDALPALLLVLSSTAATETSSAAERLTSPTRAEGSPSLDLLMLPLRLPELATELAFAPLLPVIVAVERYRLHERFFDLVTNDEMTMALVPVIDFFNRSGFSAGGAFLRNDPLGSPDRMVILGIGRLNGDYLASFSYTRRLATMSGKRIHFGAEYAFDQDERYYGIGSNSRLADERLLKNISLDLEGWLELPAPAIWNARLGVAFRRRDLSTGIGSSPGVVEGGDVPAPAGFGRTLNYPELSLLFAYDTRDSDSRPTRGIVAQLNGLVTKDIDGGETGALQASAQLGFYIPIAPLFRTLVLTAGASIALPLGPTDEMAHHALVDLGGDKRLRGYEGRRFVDQLGFWGTAEYRYKIFEWAGSGTGLSATTFVDAGRVAGDLDELLELPLRWSVGFGLRAEADLLFLARVQVAYSPDGFRFVVAVNDIL